LATKLYAEPCCLARVRVRARARARARVSVRNRVRVRNAAAMPLHAREVLPQVILPADAVGTWARDWVGVGVRVRGRGRGRC